MGYSTPKKQLDLKEFLSQPTKPSNSRGKNRRSAADNSKGSVAPRDLPDGEPQNELGAEKE